MIKNDPKFVLPDIESIIIGKRYAFTISPPMPSPRKDLSKLIWNLSERIREIVYGYDLQIYWEFSSSGRLHGHGYITFRDLHKWIFSVQGLQTLGTICIKDCEQPTDQPAVDRRYKTWDDYIVKQKSIVEPLCKKVGYPTLFTSVIDLPPSSRADL